MPSDLPSTVATSVEVETQVKRSRFVARLSPVADLTSAGAVVSDVRRQYWDARHHCTALVLGEDAADHRSSDDGEPSGTAGAPMLDVLHGRRLTDVVVVVARYFGGVLLGTGGLVRAYSGAVAAACDAAVLVRRERMRELVIDVPHAEAGRIGAFVHTWATRHRGVPLAPTYGATARLGVLVRPDDVAPFDAELAALTLGEISAARGPVRVVDLP